LEYGRSRDARRLISYTLGMINSLYETGEYKIDFDNVNIEHILPQNPQGHWKVLKADIKDYVDKLGNLTLVRKKINSKAGNKSPIAKAEELEKSGIKITRELAKKIKERGRWTKEDILKRQKELAEIAYDSAWKF